MSVQPARLFGRWGGFPCSASVYPNLENNLCSIADEYYQEIGYTGWNMALSASWSKYLSYWTYPNFPNLITGDYLYLSSHRVGPDAINCTVTLSVDFEACPPKTIPSDIGCVSYTNVNSDTGYSANNVAVAGPFTKFYKISVPQNAAKIKVSVTTSSTAGIAVFGNFESGLTSYGNFADNVFYGNFEYLFPNTGAGDLVVTLKSSASMTYNIKITVPVCPSDFATGGFDGFDGSADCVYPLVHDALSLFADSVTITIPPTSNYPYCNWKYYELSALAWSTGYVNLNLTRNEGSNTYVYIAKHAWPHPDLYDFLAHNTSTVNFTPEDFYVGSGALYYVGFCNLATDSPASWTATANVSLVTTETSTTSAEPSSESDASTNFASILFAFQTLVIMLLCLL